jgi:hypothetical protein
VGGLGIPYSINGAKGPSKSKPMILYYTPFGQVAAISMNVYGEPKAPSGYWRRADSGKYFMSVAFRNVSQVCSSTKLSEPIGNQLVINQDAAYSVNVPTTVADGITGNWTKGSCFDTMGTHYFYGKSVSFRSSSCASANI